MGLSVRFSLNAVTREALLEVGAKDCAETVSERCMTSALVDFTAAFVFELRRTLPSNFGGVGILDGGSIMVDFDFGAETGVLDLTGIGKLLRVRLLGRGPQESSGSGI